MKYLILLLIGAGLSGLVTGETHAGDVYKCKDASGKVSYSKRPCANATEQDRIKYQASRSVPEDESNDEPKDGFDELLEKTDDPALRQQLELKKQQCKVARDNLERYKNADVLIQQNADGTQQQLDEATARAEVARVEKFIQDHCQ